MFYFLLISIDSILNRHKKKLQQTQIDSYWSTTQWHNTTIRKKRNLNKKSISSYNFLISFNNFLHYPIPAVSFFLFFFLLSKFTFFVLLLLARLNKTVNLLHFNLLKNTQYTQPLFRKWVQYYIQNIFMYIIRKGPMMDYSAHILHCWIHSI